MKIKLGLGKTNMRQMAVFCGGELYDFTGKAGCEFSYVCTDSREADSETMFIATRGERVDGHDYILKALESGCRCILCEYVPQGIQGKCVAFCVVENSMDAFCDVAKGYRQGHYLYNVAITGSVGKTTTKEFVSCVLKEHFNLYTTAGNFNSIIGMPMSFMEADAACNAAVFEMGMSGFGEIIRMTETAHPDIGIITNIGSSHLEYLKTRENIAKAKFEIAEGIRENGTILLNGDEPLLRNLPDCISKKNINAIYVSINGDGDMCASNIVVDEGKTSFDIEYNCKKYNDVYVPVTGAHFVYSAMFAFAVGLVSGMSEEEIRKGLENYVSPKMRQNILDKDGIKVISDCYNAAPESMKAALSVLAAVNTEGRRIAVLGDMRELGDESKKMHQEVGKNTYGKADTVIGIGKLGSLIAKSAKEAGVEETYIFEENDAKTISILIKSILKSGDTILFKASRAMEFENIIKEVFDN